MYFPFSRPFYVMAKPCGSSCNLHCRYCYYLSKEKGLMSDALLEEFVRQFIESQTSPNVLFTWHGGEPLLMPLSFYERAMQLQQRYAGGRHIDNCLQTNGTLLTAEWCRFFRQHHFLIGISIDGPQPLHDHYRQQFDATMRGVSLLCEHEVEWNAMATVNHRNVREPVAFYRFFREMGCRYLQFTPVVEQQADGSLTPESVTAEEWGDFLIALFDEWVQHDVGHVFVQLFDATLANWVGVEPSICSMSPTCGLAPALQPNGNLYSCDHFVVPSHLLGNINRHTITELMYGEQQRRFGQAKRETLSEQCRRCQWLFACHGECPKNRILPGGQNYLCDGYRRFFAHVAPVMDSMAEELREQVL